MGMIEIKQHLKNQIYLLNQKNTSSLDIESSDLLKEELEQLENQLQELEYMEQQLQAYKDKEEKLREYIKDSKFIYDIDGNDYIDYLLNADELLKILDGSENSENN